MATHHESQTVRARCEERVAGIIHRPAHPIQLLNVHTRHTTIRNKIRKFAPHRISVSTQCKIPARVASILMACILCASTFFSLFLSDTLVHDCEV